MSSTSPPQSTAERAASDRRWAEAKAVHWHDCPPTDATRARAALQRAA